MAKSFAGIHARAVSGLSRGNSSARLSSARPSTSRQSLGSLASNVNSGHYKVARDVNSYFRNKR